MNVRDWPESLRQLAEDARTEGEIQFTKAKKHLPDFFLPHTAILQVSSDRIRSLLIEQVKAEVLKVAHGACVCARTGELKARDIRAVVETHLEMRCNHLRPYRRYGDELRFLGEVKKSLFASTEWETHLTERLEVSKSQADSQGAANPSEKQFTRESASEDPSPRDASTVRDGHVGGQTGSHDTLSPERSSDFGIVPEPVDFLT